MSVKVVTVGTKGYSTFYTGTLLQNIESGRFEYAGVIDIRIDDAPHYDLFVKNNIPYFPSLEEYFKDNTADLVIICTPTHLHAQQSIYAMEHGANVLCEKPICATFEDAKAMIEASERTGKFLAVGFQYCYSPAIINLKKDILAGVFGKPKLLKSLTLWPRKWKYYGGTRGWGGRIKDDSGNLILDSVAANATAHFLQNLLFMLGSEMNSSVIPKKVSASVLRANKIENFDTCQLRMETDDGAEILFMASHATDALLEPVFELEFENARITYGLNEEVEAVFSDGSIKKYGKMDVAESTVKRIDDSIDAIQNGSQSLTCIGKTALSHNIIINSIYEKCLVQNFSKDLIIDDEENEATYVKGLYDAMLYAYQQNKHLSECGFADVKETVFEIDKKYFI